MQKITQLIQKIKSKVEAVFSDVSPYTMRRGLVSPIPVLPELGIALGLLILVFTVTYIHIPSKNITAGNDVLVTTELQPLNEKTFGNIEIFDDVVVRAKSAVVWDVKNQHMLFNKNGDEALPLASITKLMTSLVAYEMIGKNEKITITYNDLLTEGDSGFVEGESFTLQNLADLTLIASSNDGASAIGSTVARAIDSTYSPEDIFVAAMNIKAEDLGLKSTRYYNSSGLDVSTTQAGAYGTARETALLLEHIITTIPDSVALTALETTQINSKDGNNHTVQNTNPVVNQIDGLIASKTGYTLLAGGNLVVAFNAGLDRPIIIAVLGSTHASRFDDTLLLVKKTQEYLATE